MLSKGMRSIAWNVLVRGSLLHILTSNTDTPCSHNLPAASRAEAVCHNDVPIPVKLSPLHFVLKYANASAICILDASEEFTNLGCNT